MKVKTELGEFELADELVGQLHPRDGLVQGHITAYSEVERIIRVAMQAESAIRDPDERVACRLAVGSIAARHIAAMTRDYDLSPAVTG